MTTKELAEIIGVSRVTLSKVINGAGGVSPKMEEKIRKYIEMYNFIVARLAVDSISLMR